MNQKVVVDHPEVYKAMLDVQAAEAV